MTRVRTYHQNGHFPGVQSEVLQKGVDNGGKGVAHKNEVLMREWTGNWGMGEWCDGV